MRINTSKTLLWIVILLIVAFAVIIGNSFVSQRTRQDPNIPPVLESLNVEPETELIRCDPLVFVMDADRNIYYGKNIVGNLTGARDLATRAREVIEARSARLAYARGMDLNLELPLPGCVNEPVYLVVPEPEDDTNVIALVKILREVGAEPIRLVVRKKSQNRRIPSE